MIDSVQDSDSNLKMSQETSTKVDVPLYPVQDTAGYHVRNEENEVQRPNIVDDLCAGLLLQVELQEAVHGKLTNSSEDFATLLVFKLMFQGPTKKRRFRKAEIKITFADQQQPLYKDPEVLGLWPEGDFTYDESEVDVNDSGGGGATLGGGAAGMQLGLNGNLTRNVGRKRTEQASVNGARRIEGRDWGKKNVVRLVLEENSDQKGGVASTLSAAILLKRTTEHDRFVAQIQVHAEADVGYSAATKIRRLSGKTPVNHPVIFDPKCKPTMGEAKDPSNLAAENLESIASITSTTVVSTVNDRTGGSG